MKAADGAVSSYEAAAKLRIAERTFARRTAVVTARHGLTPQRYFLLLLIRVAEQAGRPATVTTLIDPLQTSQSSVTQLVGSAESAGLVRRESDVRDGRRQYLYLTSAGVRRLERAFSDLEAERVDLVEAVSAIAPG